MNTIEHTDHLYELRADPVETAESGAWNVTISVLATGCLCSRRCAAPGCGCMKAYFAASPVTIFGTARHRDKSGVDPFA